MTTIWDPWNAKKVWMAEVTEFCPDCEHGATHHYTKDNYRRFEALGGMTKPCHICGSAAIERTPKVIQGMSLTETEGGW